MIIQFFLTGLLLGVALLVAAQNATPRLMRAGILAVLAAGAFFVWAPETTNAIAHVLGVGRGADLILYLWVVITLALMLLLYLKLTRMARRITQLTRAIALMQASAPDADR